VPSRISTLVLLAVLASVSAAQIVVFPPVPPPPVGSITSIQAGIIACPNGGTVTVMPGTYSEASVNFNGKAITVVSQIPLQAVVDATLVQPPPPAPPFPVFLFASGEGRTSVLDGFTITGGSSTSGGGGIRCVSTSPTIINNEIVSNGSDPNQGPGGGIFCSNGSPRVAGNTIVANAGTSGGGVYGLDSSFLLDTNVIGFNTALADGGGVLLQGHGRHQILDNAFSSNTALRGGGLALISVAGANVNGNSFTANVANLGGGMASVATGAATISITDNSFTQNQAVFTDGGGLHCDASSANIVDNVFTTNFADRFGGAMHLVGVSTHSITGNVVSGGNTAWQSGGGIAIRDGVNATLIDDTIIGNLANAKGGGIYVADSTAALRNNTFNANGLDGMFQTFPVSESDFGGGLAGEDLDGLQNPTTVELSGNVFTQNFCADSGAGIYLAHCDGDVRENLIRDNGVRQTTPTLTSKGGGIYAEDGVFSISANTVLANEADDAGAGIALFSTASGSILVNNIVAKNWLHVGFGAGVWLDSCALVFVHDTVAQNDNQDSQSAPAQWGPGAGVYVAAGAGPLIENCIIRGNLQTTIIDAAPGSGPSVGFSNVGSNQAGNWTDLLTNIDMLPRFVDPPNDDFHLKPTSPSRDMGSPAATGLPVLDIDGQLRVMGPAPDQGADEL
jgi:hypothetical protein